MLRVSLPPRPSSWLSPLLPVRVSLKFEPEMPSILVNVEVLKPVACAAVLLKFAVTPTVERRKSTTSMPPFASHVPVPELYTQPPEPS